MDQNADEKPRIIEKLRDYRQRNVRGEEISDEELKESIALLRQLRDTTAPKAKAAATKKATKKITHADATDLLKDLL